MLKENHNKKISMCQVHNNCVISAHLVVTVPANINLTTGPCHPLMMMMTTTMVVVVVVMMVQVTHPHFITM